MKRADRKVFCEHNKNTSDSYLGNEVKDRVISIELTLKSNKYKIIGSSERREEK